MDDKKNKKINNDNGNAAPDKIIEDSFAESISAAAVSYAESVISPSPESGGYGIRAQSAAGTAPMPHIEVVKAESAQAAAEAQKETAAAVINPEAKGEEAGEDKSETEKKVDILRETAEAEEKAEADRIKAQKKAEAAGKAKAAKAAKAPEEAAMKALQEGEAGTAAAKPAAGAAASGKSKAAEKKKTDNPSGGEAQGTESGAKSASNKKRIVASTETYKPKDITEKTAADRMKDKTAKEADPRSIAAKQEKLKASPIGKKKVNEANSGLKLLYQPVFEPAKNLLIGFECLLRIYDIELGVLTPGMFLEVAQKDIKLIKRLEDWSIEEVLRSSKKLKDQNLQILSVNISTKHFFDSDFVETTSRLIERSEIRPQNIYFEMREEVLFGPYVEVVNKFAALQALGIKIAIDDFGTNYFAGEKKPDFKLDMVKLPFAMVKQFMNDRKAKSLIRIILAYAKQKKVDVIALGVETKAQEEALLKMGVRKMQGYLYSKPLTTQRMTIKKK